MYGPLALRTKSGVVPTLFRALTGEFTPPGIICFACSKAAAEFFLSFILLLFKEGDQRWNRWGLSYLEVPICCLFDELLGIIGDDVLGAGTLDGDEALECYTALIEITELGGCLQH